MSTTPAVSPVPSNIEIAQHAKMRPIVAARPRAAGDSRGSPRALRALQGEGVARLSRAAQGPTATASWSWSRRSRRRRPARARPRPPSGWAMRSTARQAGDHLPARAGARAGVRHEGRRRRRRLLAGRADGGHQPALHRRLRRHRARQQPARGAHRQPHLPRQRSSASTCAASPGGAWSTSTTARCARSSVGLGGTGQRLSRARTASTSSWPPR